MSEVTPCPKCGQPIATDAPQGLCPRCLLKQAAFFTDAGATSSSHSEPPPLEALAQNFPHLEILEMIGRGGMGFVFKARQPKLDRVVALKILAESLSAEPSFAERFTREGRALARLNHPNIVTVHDFGQAGPFFYLLMEFVDGVNLRQAMQARQVTPTEALAIVPRICEALQYAHGEGILHRDIKPDNILLDSKGRVKIADFGIAKLLNEPVAQAALTASGATLGTVHYMAPEQIERPNTVDHRADIYSLGVVFYEMLTGELPIGRFPAPSEKGATVDPRLDKVVFKTLAKEPAKRPQSAGELGTEVQTIASRSGTDEIHASSSTALRVQKCYISTAEHLQSWFGKQWIYTGSGELRLEKERLVWRKGRETIVIPLPSITRLSLGEFPRLSKPFGLSNIDVSWQENGRPRQVLFVPHRGWYRSTRTTSETVNEWFAAIQTAVKACTGKIPPGDEPNPKSPEGSVVWWRLWAKMLPISLLYFVLAAVVGMGIVKVFVKRPRAVAVEAAPPMVVDVPGVSKTIRLRDLQGTAEAVSAATDTGLAPGETVRAVLSYNREAWAPSDETATRYTAESDGITTALKTQFTWSLPPGFATAFDVRAEIQRVTSGLLKGPITLPTGDFPLFSIVNHEGKILAGGLQYSVLSEPTNGVPVAEGKLWRISHTSRAAGAMFTGKVPPGFCLVSFSTIDATRAKGTSNWTDGRSDVAVFWPGLNETALPHGVDILTNNVAENQQLRMRPGEPIVVFEAAGENHRAQGVLALVPVPQNESVR